MSREFNIDDLSGIRRRAYRAVTGDGLLELLLGVGFVAAAIFVALDVFLDVPLFFLIGIPASLLPFLLTPLRRRFTYSRIGYVDLVSEENKRLIRGVLAAASLVGVLTLIITLVAWALQQPLLPIVALFENLAVVLGLLFGAAFLYMAIHYHITRFYVFGLLSILAAFVTRGLGTALLTSSTDPVVSWMLYFAVMAAILVPSGLVMFARFLRDNPVLDEERDDA